METTNFIACCGTHQGHSWKSTSYLKLHQLFQQIEGTENLAHVSYLALPSMLWKKTENMNHTDEILDIGGIH